MLFSAAFVHAAVASCALLVNAAPQLQGRQTGDNQCGIDRLRTVVYLQEAQFAVDTLATQLESSPLSANITIIKNGIHDAFIAIDGIAEALFANEAMPSDLIDQVGGNFSLIGDALTGLTTTDPAANATLTTLITTLEQSSFAADNVVDDRVA